MTESNASRDPATGWLEDGAHVFPLRVYYEDTDFSGVVYHTSYLRFMERGRSEFLRLCGVGHRNLLHAAEPVFWTVRNLSIRFTRPARVEDALLVHTAVAGLSGARMMLGQSITRNSEELTRAEVEVCLISGAGRPRRIPDLIRKQLELYITPKDR